MDPCSRFYAPVDFDVVAGCLHAITERREFRFVRLGLLAPREGCPGKIGNKGTVDDRWTEVAAFEAAYAALP